MTTIDTFDVTLPDRSTRPVRGEGSAVMLVNSGEATGYVRGYAPSAVLDDVAMENANAGSGLDGLLVELGIEPQIETGEPIDVFGGEVDTEVSVENIDLTETGGKLDYSGEKIGVLRKAASAAGFRAVTGLDPYKQATREQLLDFLSKVD